MDFLPGGETPNFATPLFDPFPDASFATLKNHFFAHKCVHGDGKAHNLLLFEPRVLTK